MKKEQKQHLVYQFWWIFQWLYHWIIRTPERAIDRAYHAAIEGLAIEDRFLGNDQVGQLVASSNTVKSYVQQKIAQHLKTINIRLLEFQISTLLLPESNCELLTRHKVIHTRKGSYCEPTVLQKLSLIDELKAKYSKYGVANSSYESTIKVESSSDKKASTPIINKKNVSLNSVNVLDESKNSAENLPSLEPLLNQNEDEIAKIEHMHEVTLLLRQLFENERGISKRTIGHLYDVASINLIDRGVRIAFLKKIMLRVAAIFKPMASLAGVIWLQRKSPELITNWLNEQVSFDHKVQSKSLPKLEEKAPLTVDINNCDKGFGKVLAGKPKMEKQIRAKGLRNLLVKRNWVIGGLSGALAIMIGSFLCFGRAVEPPVSRQPTNAQYESIVEQRDR